MESFGSPLNEADKLVPESQLDSLVGPFAYYRSEVFRSAILRSDLMRVQREYPMSEGYSLRAPGPDERPCHGGPNEFSVYLESFRCRFRLPLIDLVINLCDFYQISLSQLSP